MGLTSNNDKCGEVVKILKAVAHPLRLRIVALLCHGDKHVNALAEELAVNQAIVSQQLRILRMSGVVEVSRRGGYAVYRLSKPNLKELIGCMERCCSTGASPE
jgi:ArsR family transcriptional regulator